MNIQLARIFNERWQQYERGDRLILVDGEEWGRVECQGRGCHGNVYYFRDSSNTRVIDPSSKRATAYINSKIRYYDDDKRPTQERIVAKIRTLIESDALRSPSALAQDAEESRRQFLAEREREMTAALKRRQQIAAEIVAEHAASLNDREPLINAIVSALGVEQ